MPTTSSLNVLFGKKPARMERAVLDALDIQAKVFTGSKSVGDGLVRMVAYVKNLQLDLLRLYTSAVKKMNADEKDKEMLIRLIERLMENFNQALSVALAGAMRLSLDNSEDSMYRKINGVTDLQQDLDLLILEIAKYKQSILDDPQAAMKFSPVLGKASKVLGQYPVVLGYLNSIRSARYSDYSDYGDDLTDEVIDYVNGIDSAREIVQAISGEYTEVGIEELIDRIKSDVDWYRSRDTREFVPSDQQEKEDDNEGQPQE